MAEGVEIERKFLVRTLPDLNKFRSQPVRQGYLTQPKDSAQVRLRRKGQTYLLTVKAGSGLARDEREIELSKAQFDVLWPSTEGRRIEKTRWTGHLDCGAVFELDVFEGAHAPLLLVEVEFEDTVAAAEFDPPAWFGPEVTDDPAYANATLATDGRPPVLGNPGSEL